MTGNTQELDEILTKLARETTLADRAADIATTADGVKVASKRFQWSIGEAKLAILDWHNKQIEAELEALREELKHEDLKTISQIITARIDKLNPSKSTPSNKLKESTE